jgi:hypothetical protein
MGKTSRCRMKPKSPYNTDEFKELERKWYAKAEASGFRDAEQPKEIRLVCDSNPSLWPINFSRFIFRRKNERPLKTWHSLKWRNCRRGELEERENYYRWAGRILLLHSFKNRTHKRIWQLHCEGKSKREIEKAISHFKKTYKREQIGNIINQIKKEKK